MNRREFIRTAISATTLLAVSATGIFELAGKAAASQSAQPLPAPALANQTAVLASGSTSTQQTPGSPVPAGYFLAAQLSSLAGRSSAYFTHPNHGASILINLNGQWKAFSAVCTHRPCTVDFVSSELYCPCHGATFSASNGGVTGGPAPSKLEEYAVIQQNGAVYVSSAVVN